MTSKAKHEAALREQAREDAAYYRGKVRPPADAMFGIIYDDGVTNHKALNAAIEEIGEDRALEIYCDAWDEKVGVPRPELTETQAIARWAVAIKKHDTHDVDPNNEEHWGSMALGFFIALNFNPFVARRLARQVDR